MASLVLDLQEVEGAAPDLVGAKALTLARLAGEGLSVPPFFAVSAAAFVLHLVENEIGWPGEARSVDPRTFSEVRERIREAPLPDAVRDPLMAAYERLCREAGSDRVAVRSSGGEEDSPAASFAGQFTSVLNVAGEAALVGALKQCWASYLSEGSFRYRASVGVPLGPTPALGVIVQVQVLSQKAGVLFTRHPLEPDEDASYIEANFGTGESVVGGLVTPDSLTVSRSTRSVLEARIATKRRMTTPVSQAGGGGLVEVKDSEKESPVLTEDEAHRLTEVGLRIESLLGVAQDIEWAFDERGLWILQSRPLTAISRR